MTANQLVLLPVESKELEPTAPASRIAGGLDWNAVTVVLDTTVMKRRHRAAVAVQCE